MTTLVMDNPETGKRYCMATGKVMHKSEPQARQQAKIYLFHRKEKMNPYFCHSCKHFHIGHVDKWHNKQRRAKRRQIKQWEY